MSRQWERQRGEIDAYNTFLSAYHSRASYHGFSERGYVVTNFFPTIEASHGDNVAKPDFALYDDETLLLVEVKKSNNLAERHIDQVRRCNNVTIETAEDFLKDSQVKRRFGYSGDVFSLRHVLFMMILMRNT